MKSFTRQGHCFITNPSTSRFWTMLDGHVRTLVTNDEGSGLKEIEEEAPPFVKKQFEKLKTCIGCRAQIVQLSSTEYAREIVRGKHRIIQQFSACQQCAKIVESTMSFVDVDYVKREN